MFSLFSRPQASSNDVTPPEARRRQQQDGALLIDVRESVEWAAGRASGARHIPLSQLSARHAELPRDRDVLFICASGNRSRTATALLARSGHPRVFNVVGGTRAWMNAGLPVER